MKRGYWHNLYAVQGIASVSSLSLLPSAVQASKIAEEGLPEGHPVRLGIALNFSVFYFEALNDPGMETASFVLALRVTPFSPKCHLPGSRDAVGPVASLDGLLAAATGTRAS